MSTRPGMSTNDIAIFVEPTGSGTWAVSWKTYHEAGGVEVDFDTEEEASDAHALACDALIKAGYRPRLSVAGPPDCFWIIQSDTEAVKAVVTDAVEAVAPEGETV